MRADGARSPLQHRRLPAERAGAPGRPVQLGLAALGSSSQWLTEFFRELHATSAMNVSELL